MGIECLRGRSLKVVAQGLADSRHHSMYHPWRTAHAAELGVGAGSTGHKVGTATPRGVVCQNPSSPLSWDVSRGHAGWAFPFCLGDPV